VQLARFLLQRGNLLHESSHPFSDLSGIARIAGTGFPERNHLTRQAQDSPVVRVALPAKQNGGPKAAALCDLFDMRR
jgi:hypothetical protein